MIHIPHLRLRDLVRSMCERAGAAPGDAALVADHLVDANLLGHDSHGVGMLPRYVAAIRFGWLDPKAQAKVLRDSGSVLVVDGQGGLGQVVARQAVLLGIARAKQAGVALLALRNAFHIGRVGAYGELCAAAGLVSVHFVNVIGHDPLVAPYRGTDARFGTDPFCCALPGADGRPLVLDFATSVMALGKVRVAMNNGERLPPGVVLDAGGRPSTDPAVMFAADRQGAILAFGLHKGYGLALICGLLAGAVAGGGTIQPEHERGQRLINNMLCFVVDPGHLGTAEFMRREIAAMVAYVKASPPADSDLPVLVPGEPERMSRDERTRTGIPIDDTTWGQIRAAAASLGLDGDALERVVAGA
ncbi:MAG: malate/lactate/ureidoglycolate dehydrogenase [Pseudomonadota bacterium]